jgi:hypothetical protein
MATKTSSKTATRKPAARGGPAARKPSAGKAKLPRQKIKEDVEPAAKPGTPSVPSSTPEAARRSTLEAESVSLIDRKKPAKKAEDSEVKPKRTVLPPISRIRASLEKPPTLQKPVSPEKSAEKLPAEIPSVATDERTVPDATVLPSSDAESATQKVILIKPPIVVKQLSNELGVKPHQLWKKSAAKRELVFTKLNKSLSRLHPRSLKRKRNSSRGRQLSHSWDTWITAKQR